FMEQGLPTGESAGCNRAEPVAAARPPAAHGSGAQPYPGGILSAGEQADGAIILSSAGRRVGLLRCFQTALAALGLRGRLIALDAGLSAPAGHLADKLYRVPRCDAPNF